MSDQLALEFERERPRLHAVARRVLGSSADAEDAVQEAWLRISRAGTADVRDLRAWLTTVVGRVALDVLRSRQARREQLADDVTVRPWPVEDISPAGSGPAEEVELAESVELALTVVRIRGADAVARRALSFRPLAPHGRPVVVGGQPGILVRRPGRGPVALLVFTVRGDRIARLDIMVDGESLARIAPS